MKNVLLLVHDDTGQEARFQAALDLTRAVSGHLTCVDVSIMPVLLGDYAASGEALLLQEEHTRESNNRSVLERRLAVEGLPWDWIDVTGNLVECVCSAAALADVIVLNRQLEAFPFPDMKAATGAVLLNARKPVLAVPEGLKRFNVAGHAVVAFDGSAPARAALSAAVPLLKLAQRVTVIEIDYESRLIDHDEAASYLSRYGIKPVVRRERTSEQPESALLRLCLEEQADWLAMGAYGHRRVTEFLLGGVTRKMLSESAIPLFLAH